MKDGRRGIKGENQLACVGNMWLPSLSAGTSSSTCVRLLVNVFDLLLKRKNDVAVSVNLTAQSFSTCRPVDVQDI